MYVVQLDGKLEKSLRALDQAHHVYDESVGVLRDAQVSCHHDLLVHCEMLSDSRCVVCSRCPQISKDQTLRIMLDEFERLDTLRLEVGADVLKRFAQAHEFLFRCVARCGVF
jgi:hypothetical protein